MALNFILFSFVFLTSFSAWADCVDGNSPKLDKKQMQDAKKLSGTGKYGEGFYYLFKIKDADFYFSLNYQGGISGEPVFEGWVYKVEQGKISFQCLEAFGIGNYEFSITRDKKGIVVYETSGCNDHSEKGCQGMKRTYRYVWDGLRFKWLR